MRKNIHKKAKRFARKNPLQKENKISTNLYGKIKKRRQFHFLLYINRRRRAFCVDGFIFLLYMICRQFLF